ncbi:hypothetical protein AB0I76_14035, partial [Micromonospora sp. NPDC049799]
MTATSDRRLPAGNVEGASRTGRPRPDDMAGSASPVPPTGRAYRWAAAALVLGLVLAVGFAAGRVGARSAGPVRAALPASA